MQLEDLINIDRIHCHVDEKSKKRSLERLSELICVDQEKLISLEVFERFLNRERLGSTGIGHGVAIPHGRSPGIDKALGAFIQLAQPVDYDAIDNEPVDLLFALLVPDDTTEEHLSILAQLACAFRNSDTREILRAAADNQVIMQIFKEALK